MGVGGGKQTVQETVSGCIGDIFLSEQSVFRYIYPVLPG